MSPSIERVEKIEPEGTGRNKNRKKGTGLLLGSTGWASFVRGSDQVPLRDAVGMEDVGAR